MSTEEVFNLLPKYVIEWIKIAEGGLANLKNDPGKLTNFGISTPTLEKIKKIDDEFKNFETVADLKFEDALKIYYKHYWTQYKIPILYKYPADLVMFDGYIHINPVQNQVILQRSLNTVIKKFIPDNQELTIDGIIGPKTINIIKQVMEKQDLIEFLAHEMMIRRVFYYNKLTDIKPKLSDFLHPWINRIKKLHHFITS